MDSMDGRRLRVGLVGLGDIAAKAYLPLLAADAGIEPVLITRNPDRRAALQQAWRIGEAYGTVEDALSAGAPLDAAFVHAATAAHPVIGARLIEARVPTFVDKPLALSAADARALVESARAAQVSLGVCFNRRFAPAYAEVVAWSGLDTVVLTKNRVGLPDDPRMVIFDDFVHVVDTLRFLVAPSPDDLQVVARRREDGALARIAITLRQGDRIGVGIMDRDSGQTVEALEAMAPGRARRVTDLVDVVDRVGGRAMHVQPDNWASVSQQRGFTAMIAWLLGSVRAGTVLDGADALATHELCEEILGRVDAATG
jgi:virulence factor